MYSDKNIKQQILNEIDALPEIEQQTVLGIVENYIHNKADETDWNNLPLSLKERIKESIQQANEGKFILNDDAIAYIRKKYGPND